MTNRTKTISHDHRARLFWLLMLTSIFSFLIYVYAVNATTRNVALHQDLERQITSTSAELDSLEFKYIQLRNNITIELAYDYGFREIKNPLYVSRAPRASLSFNTLDR